MVCRCGMYMWCSYVVCMYDVRRHVIYVSVMCDMCGFMYVGYLGYVGVGCVYVVCM